MLKDADYKFKFEILSDWMLPITAEIKKDLKNDHLKSDRAFWKECFGGRPLPQLSEADLAPVYHGQIVDGNEELGEFVAHRWLLKHTDLYEYFAAQLEQINPDFDAIESIDGEVADRMIEASVIQFGAVNTYLFVVLNSVVFAEEKLKVLGERAVAERSSAESQEEEEETERTLQALEKRHERELKRLEDRYEKKLAGMQKKYLADTAMLKKQVANLQRAKA